MCSGLLAVGYMYVMQVCALKQIAGYARKRAREIPPKRGMMKVRTDYGVNVIPQPSDSSCECGMASKFLHLYVWQLTSNHESPCRVVFVCLCSVAQRKDEATRAYSLALALNQASCKKMLRYLAALFIFMDKLNTMAHGKLSKRIREWLHDRHLDNGLAYHELSEVEHLTANILWALNMGPAPKPRTDGEKAQKDAVQDRPFQVCFALGLVWYT